MASSNLALLQRTVNRYASKAGFAPIAADGGMGPATENAVRRALGHAADPGFFSEDSLSDGVKGIAQGFLDMISRSSSPQTVIMQKNVDINTVLTRAANDLGLPAVVAAPSGGGVPVNPSTLNAVAPSAASAKAAAAGAGKGIFDAITSMPMPMKLALAGITLGIGYFAFFDKKRKR
jgi:hypothetical protein